MIALAPCTVCSRHIRVDHSACPFCASAVPEHFASRAVPAAKRRLDRLATFTFAAAVAIAGSGCSDDDKTNASDAGSSVQDAGDDGGADGVLYGLPPTDGGDDGALDDGAAGVLYGLPPTDGGEEGG